MWAEYSGQKRIRRLQAVVSHNAAVSAASLGGASAREAAKSQKELAKRAARIKARHLLVGITPEELVTELQARVEVNRIHTYSDVSLRAMGKMELGRRGKSPCPFRPANSAGFFFWVVGKY